MQMCRRARGEIFVGAPKTATTVIEGKRGAERTLRSNGCHRNTYQMTSVTTTGIALHYHICRLVHSITPSRGVMSMSCPKCGTKVYRKSLLVLFVLTSIAIISFGVSLFLLPLELFFIFSFLLLFGIRYIEKRFSDIDKQEVRCPMCGHVVNIAHSH